MKKSNYIINAFTLPEIILSLMIIGVIAVVMLQVLVPNVRKVETRAKINAAHALISRAIIQYQAEHLCSGSLASCDEFIYENIDIEEIYDTIFADKFKLEKHCGNLIGLGCFSKDGYLYNDGTTFSNPDDNEEYYKVRLQNGIAIAFYARTPKCEDNVCMNVIIDTNGPAAPNIVNRDLFTGVVTTNLVKFDNEE